MREAGEGQPALDEADHDPARGRSSTHLDVLPDVALRVDDAHVGLIGAAVDEDAVVGLEEGVLGVVGRVARRDGALGERDDEQLLVVSCAQRR